MRPDRHIVTTQADSTPSSGQSPGQRTCIVSDQRLPRAARVRARREFAQVFEHARRVAHPLMVLHWLPDDARPARLGLAVSRKVDLRAIGRNRIKRALREEFRRLRGQLARGACVVVVRSAAKNTHSAHLRACLAGLLQRCGALLSNSPTGTMPAPPPSAD